jgi:hypothetical protein
MPECNRYLVYNQAEEDEGDDDDEEEEKDAVRANAALLSSSFAWLLLSRLDCTILAFPLLLLLLLPHLCRLRRLFLLFALIRTR